MQPMSLARKYAVLVGIESYQDPARFPDAAHAAADLAAIRDALLGCGCDPADLIVLGDDRATKTTLEHHLSRLCRDLAEDDAFVFFFEGRAASTAGSTILACRDTLHENLAGTGIDLGGLIRELRSTRCRHIQLYLDLRDVEIADEPEDIASRPRIHRIDVKEELENAEQIACFTSCRGGEASYASDRLGQGIWTHHLARVLRGDVPDILDHGGLLTAGVLQDHLRRAVAATIRETFADRRKQTPTLAGKAGRAAVVADLAAVLERKRAATAPRSNNIRDVVFSRADTVPVRALDGFAKPFTAPKVCSDATRGFVVRIAQGNIEREIEAMHARIRRNLKYPRAALRVTNADGSDTASIWTPDFQYTVEVRQLDDEPSAAAITKTLSEVRDQSLLDDQRFRGLFDACFDTVRMTFAKPVDVVAIIDAIEASNGGAIEVDYPTDCSYCDLSIAGCPGSIRIGRTGFALTMPAQRPLQTLVDAFAQAFGAVRRVAVTVPPSLSDAGRS